MLHLQKNFLHFIKRQNQTVIKSGSILTFGEKTWVDMEKLRDWQKVGRVFFCSTKCKFSFLVPMRVIQYKEKRILNRDPTPLPCIFTTLFKVMISKDGHFFLK